MKYTDSKPSPEHSARRHFTQDWDRRWSALVKDGKVDINDVHYHARVIWGGTGASRKEYRAKAQAEIIKLYSVKGVRVYDPTWTWSL